MPAGQTDVLVWRHKGYYRRERSVETSLQVDRKLIPVRRRSPASVHSRPVLSIGLRAILIIPSVPTYVTSDWKCILVPLYRLELISILVITAILQTTSEARSRR